MRASEILLQDCGIKPSTIRPAILLDIIDGLLIGTKISDVVSNLNYIIGKKEYAESDLQFLVSQPVIIKLKNNTRAIKLYTTLLTNIILKESLTLDKDNIKSLFVGVSHPNSYYRVLNKTIEELNSALIDCIILHQQYGDSVTFIPIHGSTKQEYMESLRVSGHQSPSTIDRLTTLLLVKGIDE